MGKIINLGNVVAALKEVNVITSQDAIISQDSVNNSVLICFRFRGKEKEDRAAAAAKILLGEMADDTELTKLNNETMESVDVIIRIRY